MSMVVGMQVWDHGACKEGRDGWRLAWLGLAGVAGGAFGPGRGGCVADSCGLVAVLLLFAAGSAVMLPIATFGALPPRTAWAGWSALAGRGLPWQALAALGLASAADAGRAALVPNELLNHGQPLAEAGMLLTAGCAVAGLGFPVFGRMADRQSTRRVIGAGVAAVCVRGLPSLLGRRPAAPVAAR